VTEKLPGPGLAPYTRAQRLLKTDEFSSVFRLRPVAKTRNFVLYTRENGLPQARLGVVAAKRLAPRAVTRNLVKRIAREQFRTSSLPCVDCIIRLSTPLNARRTPASSSSMRLQIRQQIASLFAGQVRPVSGGEA
jgi:ribonuclease P protein component